MGMTSLLTADISDPLAMRSAGAQWLSLALIDSRNRTLLWLSAFEGQAQAGRSLPDGRPKGPAPAWWAGQVAWFQEYWIARHMQRKRGAAADARGPRLASIEPQADALFAPAPHSRRPHWAESSAYQGSLRSFLAATLESTLELLDKSDDSDDSLYFYRLALLHEDRVVETLAALASAVDLSAKADDLLFPVWPARGRRLPIGLGGRSVGLGTPGDGFAPDNERPGTTLQVPEFEIDAQPVSWAQFAEFAADGGYDDHHWWSPEGRAWIESNARRAPRYVEQLAGGVLVHQQGQLQRAPQGQSVLHANAYEADAFCRWAGRRLPTEAEWALAVHDSAALGFVWGDGFEWVAGTARAWPGQANGPARLDAAPSEPGWRVLRGASPATVPRQRHPGARRFARAERDELFCGFRSCAL